jgi:endonuclease/exonuclease/phosphatase family metal-dependent hydrolase
MAIFVLALTIGSCQSLRMGEHLVSDLTIDDGADSFSILTANVGNVDPRCLPLVFKLCRNDVEARIAASIQSLSPDVVALQETLPPSNCTSLMALDTGNVCSNSSDIPQIRRLLGDAYTIVCESRNSYECIAVHQDAGGIRGCGQGELCHTDRIDEQPEGCRPNVAIMGATLEIQGRTFDIINAHPESRSPECRNASIIQIFTDVGDGIGLVREEHALIVGDLNMDPWRDDELSVQTWNSFVGAPETHPYYYHSGMAEHDPQYFTLEYPTFSRTYDHVVSNFLEGTTLVLGESPGTYRLDGGSGMDHRAVYGILNFEPES